MGLKPTILEMAGAIREFQKRLIQLWGLSDGRGTARAIDHEVNNPPYPDAVRQVELPALPCHRYR